MNETILNIYLIIENNFVVSFKAKDYSFEGTDTSKISFLKEKAKEDFYNSELFNSPQNSKGEYLTYKKFSKLERQGLQFQLFEEIFTKYNVAQNPLVCVTPVVDGKILSQ